MFFFTNKMCCYLLCFLPDLLKPLNMSNPVASFIGFETPLSSFQLNLWDLMLFVRCTKLHLVISWMESAILYKLILFQNSMRWDDFNVCMPCLHALVACNATCSPSNSTQVVHFMFEGGTKKEFEKRKAPVF